MQSQSVKRVVIAGGGTAGWTVAAALAQQLGSLLDITLVESDEMFNVNLGNLQAADRVVALTNGVGTITNDDAANAYLTRKYRKGWELS